MIKLNKLFPVFFIGGLVVITTGCGSNGEERPEYLDAGSVQSLEIPPRLTIPDTSGALRLPKPSDKALSQFESLTGQKADQPVAPTFKGVRLIEQAGNFSLEIDAPVDQVWKQLPEFLAAEGIEIARVERLLGYIDTRWMNEYEVSYGGAETGGWFKSLFSPDYKDRFRLRVESAGKDKTRLSVAHRGLQIVMGEDESRWQQRQSDEVLEREVLYRFALFLGASQQAATDLLSGYHGYQVRAELPDADADQINVTGAPELVWQRLQRALDRLGASVVNVDEKARKIQLEIYSLDAPEAAELESSSWLGSLFGGNVDVGDDEGYERPRSDEKTPATKSEQKATRFSVAQKADKLSSTIIISTEKDPDSSNIELPDFRDALLLQLQ